MRVSLLVISCLIVSCSANVPLPTSTFIPTLTETPPVVITPIPKVEVIDSGWTPVQVGLEQRTVNLFVNGELADRYLMARIEPDHFRFEIHYDADKPMDLADWAYETGALVVVNGSYFSKHEEQYFPTGLFIENGEMYGESFDDYAGMFTVNNDTARLSWLRKEPYQGQLYQFALQSFPMLVRPGGELGFPAEFEDHVAARRTFIAQDRHGRFILFVSDKTRFTLHQLSQYLVDSDLDLDIAMNLDGGPSSGLYILPSGTMIPPLYELPIVITVHAR